MAEPIRILHLTTTGSPVAGAERVLVDLAGQGRRLNWEMAFVSMKEPDGLQDEVARYGWRAESLHVRHSSQVFTARRRLRTILDRFRPHVLHTHLFHSSVLGALAVGPKTRLMQTRHYSDYMVRYAGPLRRRLDRWASRRCHAVAAVSEATRRYLIENEHVPADRVVTIENGVDLGRLSGFTPADARRRLAAAGVPDGPLVGCMASLHPRKGHAALLEAMARVAPSVPSARLVLFGAGPEEANLRDLALRGGVDDRVHFLGYHPDAHAMMAGFDVYVQPSLEEGFGIAVIEAMALGLPVVASNVGGMRDTVEHGVVGFHVPPGDAATLADAILRVLSDPRTARSMGEAGRSRARARYSAERMASDYDRWYRSVSGSIP